MKNQQNRATGNFCRIFRFFDFFRGFLRPLAEEILSFRWPPGGPAPTLDFFRFADFSASRKLFFFIIFPLPLFWFSLSLLLIFSPPPLFISPFPFFSSFLIPLLCTPTTDLLSSGDRSNSFSPKCCPKSAAPHRFHVTDRAHSAQYNAQYLLQP